MIKKFFLILSFLCLHLCVHAEKDDANFKFYQLVNDPVDVVIVTHPKDIETLDNCIKGIRENCSQVRRVIVVSEKPLTDNAEWFNENQFPFSHEDVFLTIGRGDEKVSQAFFRKHGRPSGWYFQQLLKLYAPFVIPDISSNVLVIDADTIFMNRVEFLNSMFGGLFAYSDIDPKERYLQHAKRLIPGYKRIYTEVYSVCHHMLFQWPILEDLFKTVEQHHQCAFWVAFCSCVDLNINKGGCSEYEIYYNYALSHTNQVQLRPLKWTNSVKLKKMNAYKRKGYHYVSFHSYGRERAEKKNPFKMK